MNLERIFLPVFALMFGVVAGVMPARASSPVDVVHVAEDLEPILPYRGAYYELGRGGTGLFLDVSPEGRLFGAFFTYDDTGAQRYYMIEGAFAPASGAARSSNGVTGHAEGLVVYVTGDGECIEGTDCPYASPSRTQVNLAASLTWTAPRHATLVLGDKTFDLDAPAYVVADGDDFAGSTWMFSYAKENTGPGVNLPYMSTSQAPVRLDPATFSVGDILLASNAGPSNVPPPEGADMYLLECVGNERDCNDYALALHSHGDGDPEQEEGALFDVRDTIVHYLLWRDPATGIMGMEVIAMRDAGPTLIQLSEHYDMYLEAPDRMIGHGVSVSGLPIPNWSVAPGYMTREVFLRRFTPLIQEVE